MKTAFLAISLLSASYLYAGTPEDPRAMLQRELGIPLSIAQVVDSSLAPDQSIPEIILIQDVHRHPEAQGQIAALILYGSRQWGVREVYLEGAEAGLAVARPALTDRADLRDALQEGRLGGAELAAALTSQDELSLFGLEEKELYKKHVSTYEDVDRLKNAALRELFMSRMMRTSFDMASTDVGLARYELVQRLLRLRLKPADYNSYLNDIPSAHDGTTLDQAMRAAELFYVLADERSRVFTDVLVSAPHHTPRVAVVGGFHTEWMAQELKKQGRSYMVLSPQITTSGFEGLYAKGMQQTISALKDHQPL